MIKRVSGCGMAVLLSVAIASMAAGARAEDDSPQPLAGSYQGQVLNGDDFDPVLTAFSRNAEGRWSGSYAIGEEEGIETGTLDECGWEAAYLLSCTWTDRYGTGSVRVLFSTDYRIFRGFWGTDPSDTRMAWDGVKQ